MITTHTETLDGRFEKHVLADGAEIFYEDRYHQYHTDVYQNPKGSWSYRRDSKLLGISTIAKFLEGGNVDGLLHWSAKLERTGIAELVTKNAEDIAAGYFPDWLYDESSIKDALKAANLTWLDIRDRAAKRGTAVHEDIFNALATGDTPPSLEVLTEEERAFGQAAFAWWRDRRPVPVAAECVTADVESGFAGRFDLLADVDGERLLIDVKTREKPKSRKSDHIQLSGYEAANKACGLPPSDRRLVLVFTPDGRYHEFTGEATADHFSDALSAAKASRTLDQRLKEVARAAEEPQRQLEAA